jgi:hypothetical protein
MAKTYDIRIVLRKAEFNAMTGSQSIVFGDSRSVYAEQCVNMTLADALKERDRLSAAEPRGHAAYMSMKYREARKPPGFDKLSTYKMVLPRVDTPIAPAQQQQEMRL